MLFLSIHPEFVAAIAAGTKTIELRRQVPRFDTSKWIAIYSSSPVMRLEGVAKIGNLAISSPHMLWNLWHDACGVSKEAFDKYFLGAKRAVGIPLETYIPLSRALALSDLRKRWPGFSPPQGFRYLTVEQLAAAPEITQAISRYRRKTA